MVEDARTNNGPYGTGRGNGDDSMKRKGRCAR